MQAFGNGTNICADMETSRESLYVLAHGGRVARTRNLITPPLLQRQGFGPQNQSPPMPSPLRLSALSLLGAAEVSDLPPGGDCPLCFRASTAGKPVASGEAETKLLAEEVNDKQIRWSFFAFLGLRSCPRTVARAPPRRDDNTGKVAKLDGLLAEGRGRVLTDADNARLGN